LQQAWGKLEWQRLALSEVTLDQFDPRMQELIASQTGEGRFDELRRKPFMSFAEEDRSAVIAVVGWRIQTEIYRQVLLGVISEQWVEYLTKVEALRVSIGMEAYAQRNPLVEYKGKASELFRALLKDVRLGVISRMFTTQPRRSNEMSVQQPVADQSDGEEPEGDQPAVTGAAPRPDALPQGKKKRRRH
jgi:preprotein translocase subunit SecA